MPGRGEGLLATSNNLALPLSGRKEVMGSAAWAEVPN